MRSCWSNVARGQSTGCTTEEACRWCRRSSPCSLQWRRAAGIKTALYRPRDEIAQLPVESSQPSYVFSACRLSNCFVENRRRRRRALSVADEYCMAAADSEETWRRFRTARAPRYAQLPRRHSSSRCSSHNSWTAKSNTSCRHPL